MKPNIEGIVYGMDPAAYHADAEYETPSLSGSLAKHLITETPRHCWWHSPRLNPKYKPQEADHFDRGSAAHLLMLGSGRAITRADFPDWRSKAAKEKRAEIRASGCIPVLEKDAEELFEMQEQLLGQLDQLEGGNPFAIGNPEVAIYWLEEFNLRGKTYSVHCRALLDWLNPDSENIYDLKTSAGGMAPDRWGRYRMWDIGAPYQAAFTRRGIRRLSQAGKLDGLHDPDFLFCLVESKPPYCCSLVAAPSGIRQRAYSKTADELVTEAMASWADCLESGEWPGYGTGVYVAEGVRTFTPDMNDLANTLPGRMVKGHIDSQDMPDSAFTPIEFKKF